MTDDLPGLDLNRLRKFLDERLPDLIRGELTASRIAGGRSNLTYEVTDESGRWVVRRPPLGHILATAHDMSREYRVISALGPSDVPVPAALALCDDPDVLGAPFYVMSKVAGRTYRWAEQLVPLGARRTRVICERMVDTLATLHAVDPHTAGLGDVERANGFLVRQVKRWKTQLDASRSRNIAGIDELYARLVDQVPTPSAYAVVHGDYRLDNLLVDDDDEIAAVVDWEMATLGDPLTDVALLLAYVGLAELDTAGTMSDAGAAPGFLTHDEILTRYGARTGRDLSAMGFYVALAHFKLAVILEGIHFRYTTGKTVGTGFATVGAVVEPVVAAGLATLRAA